MILLKKFKKLIPSYRHRTDIKIFDNTSSLIKHKKKKKKNVTLIFRKKKFFLNYYYNLHSIYNKNLTLISKNYIYKLKPYKKILLCQTLEGIKYLLPGIEHVNPGKIIYSQENFKYFLKTFLIKGFLTYLYKLPINTLCSNISNLLNTKITFAKCSGTYCKLKKIKKSKKKLLLIELPSHKELLVTKNTKVYVGKNQNFKKNELVEGKWGSSFSCTKKIKVRGVAMNPVDHPNGGRTKTVQPERSPWNWVAKRSK